MTENVFRFRTNWRGKLILQVRFENSEWLGMVYRFKDWRDAKVDDVLPTGLKFEGTK